MLPARPRWSVRRIGCKLAFAACNTWASAAAAKNPIKWTQRTSSVQRFFTPLASAKKNACHLLLHCPSPRMPKSSMAMFMHLHLLVLHTILDSMWRRPPLSVLPCRKVLICSTRLMNFVLGSGKFIWNKSMPTVDQLNVGELQREGLFNEMWLPTARRLFANQL